MARHCCQTAAGCSVCEDAPPERVPQAALTVGAALRSRQTVDARNNTQSGSREGIPKTKYISDAPVDGGELVQQLLMRLSRLLESLRDSL